MNQHVMGGQGVQRLELSKVFQRLNEEISAILSMDRSGHDYEHALRVRDLALKIAVIEGGDLALIECVALIHDLYRYREIQTGESHFGDSALSLMHDLLKRSGFDPTFCKRALELVRVHDRYDAFKLDADDLELKIVKDADRLDAIGAVGIARAFTFGGALGLHMIDRKEKLDSESIFTERTSGRTSVIGHFTDTSLVSKNFAKPYA